MTRRINGDALENRDGTAVTGDVFVFDDAHVDGGEWEAPAASAAWPVGSIFLSAVSTNPATLLGFGTWSAIGAGRVLVGIDAVDVDFDTLGETGGAKTSPHAHGFGTLGTDTVGNHGHAVGTIATVAESSHTHAGGTLTTNTQGAHSHNPGTFATDSVANHTHSSGTLIVTDPATGFGYHTRRHDHLMTEVYQHSHNIAAGQGSHSHNIDADTTDGTGLAVDIAATAATTRSTVAATLPAMVTDNTGSATARTGEAKDSGTSTMWDTDHTVSGGTGSTGGHSHTVNSGVTTSNGDHTHFSFTGATAAGSSHSHGMTGSTASDAGAHSHAVNSGSTGSDSTPIVQPYLVVAIWQRTA